MSDSDSDSCEGKKDLNTPTSPSGTVEASQEQKHPRTPEATVLEINTTETENKSDIKELPLPPALQHPNIVDSKVIKRATSERKLSYNVSKKMPRSVSVPRNWDHKENGGRKKMKLKTKESVWMKTIILGGKCVPDEEENAVIYERKGKKISAYHPRQSTSMSLSRQWSQIASSALSVPQSHEERVQSNPTGTHMPSFAYHKKNVFMCSRSWSALLKRQQFSVAALHRSRKFGLET
ncbi:hypothetical protein VNO77_32382 [Canavalia gladiata]|uniref:Uncharacterized protein n=1 Tax=Canavalia gladiata TaxID=3824 RepID=A0AAN9KPS2_CANGL